MNRKPLSILLAAAALMNIGFASASEPTMAEMGNGDGKACGADALA